MVDYDKMSRDMYAKATPQERLNIDHVRALMSIEAQRMRPLTATFAYEVHDGADYVPMRTWEHDVGVRIDRDVENWNGSQLRDVVRFSNAVTGSEGFELDDRVRGDLAAAKPGETWPICAGGGRWNRCEVDMADIAAFVAIDDERRRSEVFAVHALYQPEIATLESRESQDDRFWADRPPTPHQVLVERMQEGVRGGLEDVLVVGDQRIVLTQAERIRVEDLDASAPYRLHDYPEEGSGPALRAGDLQKTLKRADVHYAQALDGILKGMPKEHSIRLAESPDRLVAAIVGKGDGAHELRVVSGGVKAGMTLTPESVAAIAGRPDDARVKISTAALEADGAGAPFETTAGELKRVFAHHGLIPTRMHQRRNEVDLGVPQPSLATRDAVRRAVDGIGVARKDVEGRASIPLEVTKDDLWATLGRGTPDGGRVGDARFGDALNYYVDAIRQPVFKDYKPTGEIRQGVAGMMELERGFGRGGHRKLWLDPAVMTSLAEKTDGLPGRSRHRDTDGKAALRDLIDGAAIRAAAAEAERKAAKGRSPAPPTRAGGVGR